MCMSVCVCACMGVVVCVSVEKEERGSLPDSDTRPCSSSCQLSSLCSESLEACQRDEMLILRGGSFIVTEDQTES